MSIGVSLTSFFPALRRRLENMTAICGFIDCPSKRYVRVFPGNRSGIRVGQLWYCSTECFALATRSELLKLSSQELDEVPRNPRLSLGLVLLSKGYLVPEQLRVARDQSQSQDEDLDSTLIRLRMITEKQLAAARSIQWGHPVLAGEHIDREVEADIPGSILRACSAVPLHYSSAARRVLIGFVSRVDHGLLEAIESITGCRAMPCFITPSDFKEQMGRAWVSPSYKEVVIDDSCTPNRMARKLSELAHEVGASEAAFTRCKNFVWARLTGRRVKLDAIFNVESAVEVPDIQRILDLEKTIVSWA